jgi:tetratricopeptide (TPR) repeat protein
MKPITILLCCLFSINTWSQDLKSALKFISSDQFEEAEKVLEDLIQKDPTNGDIYYYYGEALLKDYLSDTFSNSRAEFAKKAEAQFQTGIKQAPGNMLNLVGMGAVTLLRTSDTIQAIPYFTQAEAAVPLNLKKKMYTPELATILTKLAAAQLYGKVNRLNLAISYLNRAKIINPADPNIYLTLGDVYIKQGDASNALFNYNQALNKDPKSPLPKIKIGNIYMRVPNLVAARPYFEEAQQIDSTFAPVYRSLGELWTLAGRHDLAKQYYYKYLQLSGNNTPARLRYGNSLFRSKDYNGALEVIEEVIKVDASRNYLNRIAGYCSYDKKPQDLDKAKTYMETFFKNAKEENIIPRDYAYYGRILYKLAKSDSVMLDKAFENLRKAYSMDESDKALLSEIASDYYYSKRYKEAIEMLNLKAEKGQAEKPDPMMIAKAYYQLNDLPKADEAFSNIIAKEPANIQAYLYLARTYSNMDLSGEQGLAKPKFENMINQIGTEIEKNKLALFEAYSYMGSYYMLRKDYESARPWYDKLYNLDPKNKEWQIKALSSIGVIYYRQKNYVEAKNTYQKILDLDPGNAEIKQAIQDLNKAIAAAKR